ncbi:unnamed protein product [marine sediment metagenome]|uniref:Uncharacterized protein n=1 Tax=marine sediment metagenome TaxID=412755 RepID=X1DVJ4_9ZZZZ
MIPQQNIITLISLFVLGALFSMVGFFIKKSVVEKLYCIEKKLQEFKEEILKNYVTKEEFKENFQALICFVCCSFI